jgi:hypothetical protein
MDKNMIAPEEGEPPGRLSVFGQLRIKGTVAPSKYSVTQASEETKIIWIRKNKGISGSQPDPRVIAFRTRFFPDVADAKWNDWHWQLRHRISHLLELERFVRLSNDERDAMMRSSASPPVAITPYFASLLDAASAWQPRKTSSTSSLCRTSRNQATGTLYYFRKESTVCMHVWTSRRTLAVPVSCG